MSLADSNAVRRIAKSNAMWSKNHLRAHHFTAASPELVSKVSRPGWRLGLPPIVPAREVHTGQVEQG
jgi:hypothetical protein